MPKQFKERFYTVFILLGAGQIIGAYISTIMRLSNEMTMNFFLTAIACALIAIAAKE